MIKHESLNAYARKLTGKYYDRLHYVTPIVGQYHEHKDNKFEPNFDIHSFPYYIGISTNTFYSPYPGFGYYRIHKPYVNVAIIPLKENEKFTLTNNIDKLALIAEDVYIDSENIPTVLSRVIPYIEVQDKKCYYDNINKSFGYNKNNSIHHEDPKLAVNSIYQSMIRNNYTHFTILYFSVHRYKVK